MPPAKLMARHACLPLLAVWLMLPQGAARAAGTDGAMADLGLAADLLSSGQQGASHALVSIGDSAPVVTDGAPAVATLPDAQGFDPAALDPAVARPGDVLQTGVASWYGSRWSGRRTASGTRFNPEAMTAASPTLPLGTRVLVTLEGTARSVLVTITDRGGAAARIIDLSRAAARRIGLLGRGTGRVVLRRA